MESNVSIENVIDSSYADSGQIVDIQGEGTAATYVNGEWVGNLANAGFSSGGGYIIQLNGEPIEFQWNTPEQISQTSTPMSQRDLSAFTRIQRIKNAGIKN